MGAISRRIIRFLLRLLGLFVSPVAYLITIGGKKKIPPIDNPLLLMSATKLADGIRNKTIKSHDVVAAYIRRCEQVNPVINAIVEPRYERAIKEAIAVDVMVTSGEFTPEDLERIYPLLGVPITVKESIAVEGMSNDAGRFKSQRTRASSDAECVSQVRAAGAIPILVSNTPELCMCWETFNYVTGKTKNPYDTRRTSGGSSGGEASLLASGASVIGIGSDIAGSLRLPAMYTGIFGHKPTPRMVSTAGHEPSCINIKWNDYFTLGPMVRYAEDLPLLLRVLRDPKGPEFHWDKNVQVQNLKFYYVDDDGTGIVNKINPDMRMAMERVSMHLKRKYGISLVKADLKYLKYSFEASLMGLLRLDGVGTIFSKPEDPIKWSSVTVELLKKIFGCSKSIITSVAYGVMKKVGNLVSDDHYDRAEETNEKIRREFMNLLQDDAVCLYPTFVRTAPYHYEYLRHLTDYSMLMLFNSLGFPVTNCPVGFTESSMPVGLQVVASPGCDHLLFAVAKEFQDAFGGWIPPT